MSVCVCTCAHARMCREEENRTEGAPVCPSTPMFTLAASVSHSGKWRGLRVDMISGICPQTCQFLGHFRADSFKTPKALK